MTTVSGWDFSYCAAGIWPDLGVSVHALDARIGRSDFGKLSRTVEARPHKGTVTGTNRRADGADSDSLVVSGRPPEGEVLRGRTILLTDGEGSTHGFEIAGVERAGGRTLIHLSSDPAVRIDGRGVKMMYFLHWEVNGRVSYHIPGVASSE